MFFYNLYVLNIAVKERESFKGFHVIFSNLDEIERWKLRAIIILRDN